jgi:hypothetical protein
MTAEDRNALLTAYALGELEAGDREAVAKLLADDADARAEVQSISHLADALSDALRREPAPALSASQRHAITVRARRARPLPPAAMWTAAAVAAAAAVAIAAVVLNDSTPQQPVARGADPGGANIVTAVQHTGASSPAAMQIALLACCSMSDSLAGAHPLLAPVPHEPSMSGAARATAPDSRVRLDPPLLDLGKVATGDSGVGVVTLTNASDHPIAIRECRPSCECTTSKCPDGPIGPGESVNVEIQVRSGHDAGRSLTKSMTFFIEGHAPIVYSIRLETFSYIAVEPGHLNPDAPSAGATRLRAVDHQPFRIVRVEPAVVRGFSDAAAAEQVLQIDWSRWELMGRPMKIVVETDHPHAAIVHIGFDPTYIQQHIDQWQQVPGPTAFAPAAGQGSRG